MGIFRWTRSLASRPGPDAGPKSTGITAANAKGPSTDLTATGIALLDAGNVRSAAQMFQQAVEREPGAAVHRVNLAYALQQCGESAAALEHLQRAAALDPISFDAHYMLGLALEREVRLQEATVHLRRAQELRPSFMAARGDLCRVLASCGDLAGARSAIADALALAPDDGDLHRHLANLCLMAGDPASAARAFAVATRLQPRDADTHLKLGMALQAVGDETAASSFEAALELDPTSHGALTELARARRAAGRLEEAASLLERAAALREDDADLVDALGGVLFELGRYGSAAEVYRKGLALRPDRPAAYANLAAALQMGGDSAEAVAMCRAGLGVKPTALLHDTLSAALRSLGAIDEAIEHLQRALALEPDNFNAHANLAATLDDIGDTERAIDAYRDALALRPDHLLVRSGLIYDLSIAETDSERRLATELRAYDAMLQRGTIGPLITTLRNAGERLRVGIVSGDLYAHPVGRFVEGVFDELDPQRVALYAYRATETFDELSARLRPRFVQWRSLKSMSDAAGAQLVRDDGVDVLIDLSGHSAHNRLGIFALRAAPIQVTWLGYFGSTGVAEMDYILADEVCVPIGSEARLAERVWRLPQTRMCYTPPAATPHTVVAPLPATVRGRMTFGCFQRFQKVTDSTLALWAPVLRALPDARLLMQCPQAGQAEAAQRMRRRLWAVGIAADRVEMRGSMDHAAYLQAYGDVDVVLDTIPYNGGTTTCEALWMGVPTLTLAGESMLARQGAALMCAAKLADWVAVDADDFIGKAIASGRHPRRLAEMRAGLRDHVRRSALFDARLFARHLEEALFTMAEARFRSVSSET